MNYKNCENCKHKEDDFLLKTTRVFPYKIPKFYDVILIEKNIEDVLKPVKAFIKNNNIYISAEDYLKDAKYILHFKYPHCLFYNTIVPQEYYCEHFESIK